MNKIESKDNPKIKRINKLKQKKYREQYQQSLVEGLRSVKQLTDNLIEPEMLLFSEDMIAQEDFFALHNRFEEKSFVVSAKIFATLAETVNTQGVLGVFAHPHFDLEEIISKERCRIVLLDQVQDPGNLGTIIRTADSAGFDLLLYTKGTTDIFSEKVNRSALGANFYLPIFSADWEIISMLKERGFSILAAMLDEASMDFSEANYSHRLVLVLGNEANGVSEEIAELAQSVMIPIYGRAESLNVAVAAGILMYKAVEQK